MRQGKRGKFVRGIFWFFVFCFLAHGQFAEVHAGPASIENNAAFQQSEREIQSIISKVDGFEVVELPPSGKHILTLQQSLTIDDLRGVVIDENPPEKLFDPVYNAFYENTGERTGDGVPQEEEPYRVAEILPFRFHHFTNEFSFTGYFNWEITDDLLMYGFNAANYAEVPDIRTTSGIPVANTKRMSWRGFNWDQWRTSHGIDAQRLDLMPSREELLQDLLNNNVFASVSDEIGHDYFMVDLESPSFPMPPDELRSQDWYPGRADPGFEDRYVNGWLNSELASVDAARAQGWQSLGIYGWSPSPSQWWGLENRETNPQTDWAWNRYGKSLYRALDVIYFSTYLPYWDEKNVAYSLATTDFNFQMIAGEEIHKPLRPYISNLLTGGGSDYRWWKWLPVRNEDMIARTAMNFFTGADGLVFWNDSMVEEDGIIHNHHRVEVLEGKDYSVKAPFAFQTFLTPAGQTPSGSVKRYDAIHVLDLDEVRQEAYFQIVQPTLPRPYGIDLGWQANARSVQPQNPIYKTGIPELKNHLRAKSEPIASIVEGLALVRPFEYTLKQGEVKIDIPAKEQFRDTLPIVRRVKLGNYHIVATYDPQWQKNFRSPRTIRLENLDGNKNLDLELPADAKTRIFVLKTNDGTTGDPSTPNLSLWDKVKDFLGFGGTRDGGTTGGTGNGKPLFYVANENEGENNAILGVAVFDANGNFVKNYVGSADTAESLASAAGLTFFDGDVFMSARRILRLDLQTDQVFVFDTHDYDQPPNNINALCTYQGAIVSVGSAGSHIHIIDPTGAVVGYVSGFNDSPQGCAEGTDGKLYVIDRYHIYEVAPDGNGQYNQSPLYDLRELNPDHFSEGTLWFVNDPTHNKNYLLYTHHARDWQTGQLLAYDISADSSLVIADIPSNPRGVTIDPWGQFVYVSQLTAGSVVRLNLRSVLDYLNAPETASSPLVEPFITNSPHLAGPFGLLWAPIPNLPVDSGETTSEKQETEKETASEDTAKTIAVDVVEEIASAIQPVDDSTDDSKDQGDQTANQDQTENQDAGGKEESTSTNETTTDSAVSSDSTPATASATSASSPLPDFPILIRGATKEQIADVAPYVDIVEFKAAYQPESDDPMQLAEAKKFLAEVQKQGVKMSAVIPHEADGMSTEELMQNQGKTWLEKAGEFIGELKSYDQNKTIQSWGGLKDVDPSETAYEIQASLKELIGEKDSYNRPLLSVMEGTADKRAVEVALIKDQNPSGNEASFVKDDNGKLKPMQDSLIIDNPVNLYLGEKAHTNRAAIFQQVKNHKEYFEDLEKEYQNNGEIAPAYTNFQTFSLGASDTSLSKAEAAHDLWASIIAGANGLVVSGFEKKSGADQGDKKFPCLGRPDIKLKRLRGLSQCYKHNSVRNDIQTGGGGGNVGCQFNRKDYRRGNLSDDYPVL